MALVVFSHGFSLSSFFVCEECPVCGAGVASSLRQSKLFVTLFVPLGQALPRLKLPLLGRASVGVEGGYPGVDSPFERKPATYILTCAVHSTST